MLMYTTKIDNTTRHKPPILSLSNLNGVAQELRREWEMTNGGRWESRRFCLNLFVEEVGNGHYFSANPFLNSQHAFTVSALLYAFV